MQREQLNGGTIESADAAVMNNGMCGNCARAQALTRFIKRPA